MDTITPQKVEETLAKQTQSEFLKKPYEAVWQDRSASDRARIASVQASRANNPARSQAVSKNSDRAQKRSPSRRTVQAIGWVESPISVMIDEAAREWHTTRSQAISKLIKIGLTNNVLSATTNLFADIIRDTFLQECRRFFVRITSILFRMYVLLCQVLHVQKNLLARSGFQKRLSAEELDKIIAWSRSQAKDDVVKGTPGGDTLDQAIGAWLEKTTPQEEGEREKEKTQQGR